MTLAARILRPSQLASSDRDAMFALMDRHYENMIRARFETDLSEKDWVILLIDEASSDVCGFSTQALISLSIDDRPIRCIFSGVAMSCEISQSADVASISIRSPTP